MCSPASLIVTRTKVLFSELTDRHEDIIKEFGLDDSTESPDFVRVEIVPEDDNYKLPLSKWVYRVDQDFLPEWYSPEEAELAARATLKVWDKHHIIRKGKHILTGNISRIIFGGDITIDGQSGGNCQFYNSSKGTVSNQSGGDCWFYDSSRGTVSNQSGGSCRFYDSSKGTVSNQSGGVLTENDNVKIIK